MKIILGKLLLISSALIRVKLFLVKVSKSDCKHERVNEGVFPLLAFKMEEATWQGMQIASGVENDLYLLVTKQGPHS